MHWQRRLMYSASFSPIAGLSSGGDWKREVTNTQHTADHTSHQYTTRRATINQHPLPGKDNHHQNSTEPQTGEGCIPPSWQARPGGFGTSAFRPQQVQRTHAQETKYCSFPNVHGATKLVSLHDLQTEVKWRSLEERRRGYRLTLLNYKMYNGLSPNDLSSLVPPPNFQCETSEIQIIFALFSPAHLCTSSVPGLFITYIMRHIWIAWVPRMICVLQLFSSCSHQGNATIYLMR